MSHTPDLTITHTATKPSHKKTIISLMGRPINDALLEELKNVIKQEYFPAEIRFMAILEAQKTVEEL